MLVKPCTLCKEVKTIDKFYKNCIRCRSCLASKRRDYNSKNREHVRAYARKYDAEHKEARKQRDKISYDKRRESILKQKCGYYVRNKDMIKSKVRESGNKRRFRNKLDLIIILGGKCAMCGLDDILCLQFDHIHDNGAKEREHVTQDKLIRRYVKNPEQAKQTMQLLCANCHHKKSWGKAFMRYLMAEVVR